MSDTTEREDALGAIADIARRHGLSAGDIADFMAGDPPAQHHKSEVLTKLFGYLGGLLVFAGLVVYAGMHWDGMGSVERIGITFGPGVIAYVLAVVCLRDPRYIRAATPLFLLAGLMQPGGMLVAIAEYSQGGDERHALLLVFGIMAVTYGISRTRYAAIAGFWYFTGSAAVLAASWDILERSSFDVLFLDLACFLMFLSLVVRSRALLLNGTLGVLFFIGYYTAEYFSDVGGWPLVLLILGLVLIGMSKVALDLNRKYIRNMADEG